uniref:Ubiquitin carboxyl-terminal hydrolase 30 n=1 Tax=Periophthalmus magnuspinnatus TaxID=409849 RepID=A0A3B4B3L6_9GOBI
MPQTLKWFAQQSEQPVPASQNKMIKHWGVIGGIAAAIAAGVYVLWGPITEKKKRKKGMVPGLLNLGNTCFLNSLLQGLAACPSFVIWLERFSQSTLTSRETPLSKTLLKLLKALSSDEPSEEDILDAGCVLDVLRLYRWHISSFEEQVTPLHPIPSTWKFQHPFHGRLTSNMSCKRCEHLVCLSEKSYLFVWCFVLSLLFFLEPCAI